MQFHTNYVRIVLWGLAIFTAAIVGSVALYNPNVVSLRGMGLTEFVQSMTPLITIALFIERVLEVLLASWRACTTGAVENRDQYRADTRRIAFFTGTTLGVVIAALGVRMLEMFVDPAAVEALGDVHQRLFRGTDVLLTGAVLGGGSDALHQLVLVFTNFFKSANHRVNRQPVDVQQG